MKITIAGKMNIKSADLIIKNHGLDDYGAVQTYIDNECIKLMEKYTPFESGFLSGPAILLYTDIGSGEIHQHGPYARYLYHGEVFGPNIPLIIGGVLEGFYSPPHKEPTGRPLQYNTTTHPLAGPFWFERMKADYNDQILAGAREIARRLSK